MLYAAAWWLSWVALLTGAIWFVGRLFFDAIGVKPSAKALKIGWWITYSAIAFSVSWPLASALWLLALNPWARG